MISFIKQYIFCFETILSWSSVTLLFQSYMENFLPNANLILNSFCNLKIFFKSSATLAFLIQRDVAVR